MSTEFSELLSLSPDDKTRIWIIGSRDQVIHNINEMCVLRYAPDRAKFSPLIPVWFAPGHFISVLTRYSCSHHC